MRLHEAISLMNTWRDSGRPATLWGWAQISEAAIGEGERAAVRACAVDPGADPLMRACFLRALGGPRDEAMVAAARDLLGSPKPWIVYAVLEGLRAVPEPSLADVLAKLLDDPRSVADMWWEERIANLAALALRARGADPGQPPLAPWLEARRREIELHRGTARFHAITVLVRFGDAAAIAAAHEDRDPGDPFDLLGELLLETAAVP